MSTQQHVPLFATLMARLSNSGSFDVSSREVYLSSPEGSVTPFFFIVIAPQWPEPTKLHEEFDLTSDFEHALF